MLQSLQDKNNGEKTQTDIGRDSKVGESAQRKGSTSNISQNYENQAKWVGKRKIDHLEGEFKKIKPTSFDEESRTREEAKAWLLDIKKYFQIYNHSSNMKVIMAIYQLKGKVSIWW